MEQAIIHNITIQKSAERQHFQIKLPRDTKRIVGIETSMRVLQESTAFKDLVNGKRKIASLGVFQYNVLMGELRLQSNEAAGFFFSAEIVESDINLNYGDYIRTVYWGAEQCTHGYKREEDAVMVDRNTTVINGNYKDNIGTLIGEDLLYQVKVIVWTEKSY